MSQFIWKDTEGSGTDTRYDQILQAAAILTDEHLNEIDFFDLRCRRLPQVIPNPVALAVTNMNPWKLKDAPLSFHEMSRLVHAAYSRWSPGVFIGQNILGYDEEIERTMFYLNMLDPYVCNTKGSTRVDTLPLLRFAHAIRPGLLKIRNNEETGSPIFKLDRLAPDNGFESHHAHDAVGDIRANIFVAKIVKDNAADIWSTMMRLSQPDEAEAIAAANYSLLMTHFGKAQFMPTARVCVDPNNKKRQLMIDLSADFRPWLDKTPEEIAEKMFSKESPFQTVTTNKMPTIFAPDNPVVSETWKELTNSLTDLDQRRFDIMSHATFIENCEKAFHLKKAQFAKPDTIEERIYDGFFSWGDKDRMKAFNGHRFWSEKKSTSSAWRMSDKDNRLYQISTRLFWTEAPQLLDPTHVEAIDRRIAETRILAPLPPEGEERPRWTTLALAREELPKIVDHPLYSEIVRWYDSLEAAVRADVSAVRTFDGYPSSSPDDVIKPAPEVPSSTGLPLFDAKPGERALAGDFLSNSTDVAPVAAPATVVSAY